MTKQQEEHEQQSLLLAIRVAIEAGATIRAMGHVNSHWGLPLVHYLVGTSAASNSPSLWISLEQPFTWLRPDQPIDKRTLEALQAERFANDARMAAADEPFLAIQANDHDPPDFNALAVDGTGFGLELAALALQERRNAEDLFMQFRHKLWENRNRTRRLVGTMVLVWFGEGQSPTTRPPRKSDTAASDELIEAFLNYELSVENLLVPSAAGMPAQMPDLGVHGTPRNAFFYAMPFTAGVPTSPFFCSNGFDVALAFTTTHTAQSVQSIIAKLVADHDQAGVDVLLISSSAPDRFGAVHYSEDLVAEMFLQHPIELVTQHIRSVTLHRWITGEAYELLGSVPSQLWGPTYQGFAPSFQQFVTQRVAGAKEPPAGDASDEPRPSAKQTARR